MKIRDLFNFFQFERKLKNRERKEPFQSRPCVEELEPRLAPAQNTWIGPPLGVWAAAANWDTLPDPDSIPGPGHNLVFGNPGSTGSSVVDAAYTVDRINMNSSYAGPLFIPDPGEDSITTTNYIDQWGVLHVFLGASINTNGTYYNTLGTIVASGPLAINASNGVDDGGAIYVTGGGALAITTGAYVQQPAGIMLVEGGLTITATNQIALNGTIAVLGGLALSAPTITIHGSVLKVGPGSPPFVWPPEAPPPVSAISATTFFNQHGTVTTGPVFNYNDVAAAVGGLPAAPIPGRFDISGQSLTVDPGAELNAGDGSQINITAP